MDTRKLLLIGTALVIAVGSAVGVNMMLQGSGAPAAAAATAEANGPQVLVATRLLPIGTIITADAFRFQAWPGELVQGTYFVKDQADVQKLVGNVVRTAITAGQPFTRGALVHPDDRGFLAAALQPGMRAVTVPVNAEQGVAGFVFPGDRVDVLLTQTLPSTNEAPMRATETVVRNVRVLATDQTMSSINADGKEEAKVAAHVTLEVTPAIAERLALSESMGAIRLVLRPLTDGAGDIDGAIASGDIKVDKAAMGPGGEAALRRQLAERPLGATISGMTSSEVSPAFASARAAVIAKAQAEAAAQRRQAAGGLQGPIIRDATGPSPALAAAPGAAAQPSTPKPVGPVVRVTRGSDTIDVPVGGN